MFFIVGILLLLCGLALLVNGSLTLPNGKIIAGRTARQLAVLCLGYLPAIILIRVVLQWIVGGETINFKVVNVIYAILTLGILVAGVILLVRAVPSTPSRTTVPPESGAGAMPPPPPLAANDDPFHFS